MQIVKGNRNSKLKKDEDIHLRINEFPRNYGKNDPHARAFLRLGGVVGNIMADRQHGCPGGIPCNTQSKEQTGEKRERERGNELDAVAAPPIPDCVCQI